MRNPKSRTLESDEQEYVAEIKYHKRLTERQDLFLKFGTTKVATSPFRSPRMIEP
jgi:hypothetical protein